MRSPQLRGIPHIIRLAAGPPEGNWRTPDVLRYTARLGSTGARRRVAWSFFNLTDVALQRLTTPARSVRTAASRDSIASAVGSVRRLVRVLRLHAQRTQTAAGVGAAQLFVLQQLGDGEDLSLNELAARTLTDRSSVADIVDRLRAQGLVDRAVDPSDRRRAAVRITALGRRTLSRAPEAPTTALIAALRAMNPRDCRALARSLIKLNRALGAADEPAPMLFADDPAPAPAGRASRHARTSRSP